MSTRFYMHSVIALVAILVAMGGGYYHRNKDSNRNDLVFHEDAPDWYNTSFEEAESKTRQVSCTDGSDASSPTLYQSLFVDGSRIGGNGSDRDEKVQIAVDVYLPCDYDSTKQYPLFFHMTRYSRRLSVRWPFSWIMGTSLNSRSKVYVNTFVPAGYALVTMDVRGSGASSGSRSGDLLTSEVDDCVQVLAWAKGQPWFGGKVVTGGISYDGMTAMALAARGRGVVDVALLIFAPMHVYEELAMPGGVPCKGFVDPYFYFTRAVETATSVSARHVRPFSYMARFFFNVVVNGPSPPTTSGSLHGKEDHAIQTRRHVQQHAKNWDIRTVLRHVQFTDDVAYPQSNENEDDYLASQLGINRPMLEQLVASNVRIMTCSGYYDSGAIRTSATLFEAAATGQVHVTIGPWTHGVRQSSSPFERHRHTPGFSLGIDLLLYTDHMLGRHITNHMSAKDAPLVRVFQLQSHTWHSTNSMDWANGPIDSPASTSNVDGHDHVVDERNGDVVSFHYSFDDSKSATKSSLMLPRDDETLIAAASSGREPHTLAIPSFNDNNGTGTSLPGTISRWNLIQQILLMTVRTNIPLKEVHETDFVKFTVDLTKEQELMNSKEDRIQFGVPVVRAQVRVRSKNGHDESCASEASLFFYLLLEDDEDGHDELKYLTETQLRLGHRPLNSMHQRDYARSNFDHLVLNQYHDLQVGLEPIRFSWKPSHQKLVLLVGRQDDESFLVPHPAATCQEADFVDLIDVSVELPTLLA